MARSYKRDSEGKFAGGSGTGAKSKVSPSPRRLNKNEKIAAQVMANKSLKSDRQRYAEASRLGFKGDLGSAFASVRSKIGNPADKAGSDLKARKKAQDAALDKVLGKTSSRKKK